jgi:gliding motility-associated-like protein
MRFNLVIVFLICAGALFGQSTNPNKLLAYFNFDNCLIEDETGNGSIGTFIDDTTCICGLGDQSVSFDGNDDALLLVGPFKDIFTTSDFTISFYLKPTPPGTGVTQAPQTIMNKQSACNTKNAFWVRYRRLTNQPSGNISVGISENDTLATVVQSRLDADVCWQFITIVRNDNRLSLYINGELRDTKTTIARLDLSSNAPFKIGEPVCPTDTYFDGALDELRFFSKALEPDAFLEYFSRPNQIVNGDTLIYLGNSVNIKTNDICTDLISWTPAAEVSDPGSASPVITPGSEGISSYVVEFRTGNGCTAKDTIHIEVINPNSLDCNQIFIPNAFTPGGSPGRNDVFGIANPFAIRDFMSFEIFDRWGGRVFSAANEFETWDGKSNGSPLNPGTFLYRLRYKCDGVEKVKSGTVVLIR